MTASGRLVVVGASLAGLRAVESARRAGFTGPIALVGAESHLPYDRPPLSKAFLDADPPAAAVPTFREHDVLTRELDVDVRLGTPATGLDAERQVVRLGDDELPYETVVIATGASARPLPGSEHLPGVHTLRTVDDALRVRAALDAGARTVVVGAGFIGSEVASSARKRGLPVTVVEALPVPLTRSVGDQMGSLLAAMHTRNGTDLRCGVGVARIDGGRELEVVLTDGAVLPADLVVVGTGAAPATGWLEGSAVPLHERDRGVVCDGTLYTGVPGVYAAGDVAHWVNDLFGQSMRLEHWTSAAEQGALAARNALDPATAKAYTTVPYFWSDWYDSRIQFVGVPSADEILVVENHHERGLLALYRRGERLVGTLTVDRPTQIMKYRRLIAQRAPWDEALDYARASSR